MASVAVSRGSLRYTGGTAHHDSNVPAVVVSRRKRPDEDEPLRFTWERIVRRVPMKPAAKLVALTLATYSNGDGGSIYPGVVKLANVTGLSEKWVRVALATLRDLGLIERTREGSRNGRRAWADEYQLCIPAKLLDEVELLPPDEMPRTPVLSSADRPRSDEGTPVLSSADGDGSASEHRYSVPGTPVLSSGTPVLSSTITGTQFPPPLHDQHNHHPTTTADGHVEDVSTDRARDDRHRTAAALNGKGNRS